MTDTTTTNAAPTLDQLKAMLAGFSAADVKKLLKETEANKPTMLSLTCEALVTAQLAGPVLSAEVTKATTVLARAADLLKTDEDANASSVAQIIRICAAHDAAMIKAGYQWSKKEAPAPVVEPVVPVNGAPVEPAKDDDKPAADKKQSRMAA